jgi:hypothetical protein
VLCDSNSKESYCHYLNDTLHSQIGIAKCHKSVTEVRLAGGGNGSSIDLQAFAKCSKLAWLEVRLDDCYMRNTQLLPLSLRHLSLNGPLTSEDLQIISAQLQNLERFSLDNNLPSLKYTFYGDEPVISGCVTKKILKGFLSLPHICLMSFRLTRMEVHNVSMFLSTVEGINKTLFRVEGYPADTFGSLEIRIPFRNIPRYVT